MRVLAISAHPDDETLGCGGTLLKHAAAGDKVFWLILTQPQGPQWSTEVVQAKAIEIEQVVQAYGMVDYFRLDFTSTRLDTVPKVELIARIREVISQTKPNIVYMVHHGDVHTDHHAAFTATMSVLKSFYMSHFGVSRVMCFETLSSTEAAPATLDRIFIPNVFNDISDYIERKIEIMSLFESEVQADPLPRGPSSIRALARHRGATVGIDYAEAFMLIRELG